jgi:hypothetical protein
MVGSTRTRTSVLATEAIRVVEETVAVIVEAIEAATPGSGVVADVTERVGTAATDGRHGKIALAAYLHCSCGAAAFSFGEPTVFASFFG